MSRIAWVFPIVVLGLLLYLNCATFERGSLTFEEHCFVDEFGPSRGWPFRAYAPTNDQGVALIRAGVTVGGKVYRDVFDGQYPHLAVNRFLVTLDLLVAVALAVGAGVVCKGFLTVLRMRAERGRGQC